MIDKSTFFVVTRYNEDWHWIEEYTNNYIVYNKGKPFDHPKVLNVKNISGNIKDIPEFIICNYSNLPERVVFSQASPYEHCNKETFNNLINNKTFTSLESYGLNPANAYEGRTLEGGFLEKNNDWYISIINNQQNQICKYSGFDDFMNHYFENYTRVEMIRFAPGACYIVPKENILYYPAEFWQSISDDMQTKFSTESFIVERALWYIFSNIYKLKER